MDYNTKIAREIFELFKDNKLVDILADENQKMMFVLENNKCLRGLTILDNGYEVQLLKISHKQKMAIEDMLKKELVGMITNLGELSYHDRYDQYALQRDKIRGNYMLTQDQFRQSYDCVKRHMEKEQ